MDKELEKAYKDFAEGISGQGEYLTSIIENLSKFIKEKVTDEKQKTYGEKGGIK
jgi:hypothetical protein